jgi:5'-nucleotidase
VNDVALDTTKTYRVVTNSFLGLGTGGDNFSIAATQGTNVLDTKILDLDGMIAFFKDKSPVAPPAARIMRLN